MPSFKERFRPSRKYKKNKDSNSTNNDETGSTITASGTSTTGVSSTPDDSNGSSSLLNYPTHYSVDYCK